MYIFLIERKKKILLGSKYLEYHNKLSIFSMTFLAEGLLVWSLGACLWAQGVNSTLQASSASVKHIELKTFFSCTFLLALSAVQKLGCSNCPSWPQLSPVLIKCPVLLLRPLAGTRKFYFWLCNYPTAVISLSGLGINNKAPLLRRRLGDLMMKNAI